MTLRVGIGGPVGSGKTALTLALCKELRDRFNIAVVTNDIYTEEDAQFLVRNDALAAPASSSRTCWSSTRSTWRRWSARRWK